MPQKFSILMSTACPSPNERAKQALGLRRMWHVDLALVNINNNDSNHNVYDKIRIIVSTAITTLVLETLIFTRMIIITSLRKEIMTSITLIAKIIETAVVIKLMIMNPRPTSCHINICSYLCRNNMSYFNLTTLNRRPLTLHNCSKTSLTIYNMSLPTIWAEQR